VKLRTQLLLAQGPLALALALVGAVQTFTVSDLVQSGQNILKDNYRSVLAAQRMKESIERMDSAAMFLLVDRRDRALPQAEEHRARFEAALKQKVEWFGGRLLPIQYAGGSPRVVADTLTALRRDGAEVLIVAGASALDPLDPVFGGLTLLGARMERHGAPAHPGSLLWLALWDGKPVLGMPTCGMFSQATTFDLALPQILAGERVDNHSLAEMGHGGLLSRDMAYRFPPYRSNAARGGLE